MPHLLATRRFLPLFVTQFLGAFNDNVFKNALVVLMIYRLGSGAPMLVTLAGALFMLPYLFFSATAGQLADKYDRARLARWIKLAEIILMLLASIGFAIGNMYFLLFVLFCLGAQATFFGPIKYALLPQHLHEDELITGNAWIEAGTFLAILAGTLVGGLLILRPEGIFLISAMILLCALGGYMASRYIPMAGMTNPGLKLSWNMAKVTRDMIAQDRNHPRVYRAILGISWFWLIGATFLSQFPAYAKETLHADETVVTLFLFIFSLGIGLGSFLCDRLLKGSIQARYAPVALAGITVFTLDLWYASGGVTLSMGALIDARAFIADAAHIRILFDLCAIAMCGGVYVVPLYAIMQHDSDPAFRARTIASNNVLNALFMVASAIAIMLLLAASLSAPQLFLTLAVCNGFVAVLARRWCLTSLLE